MASIVVTTTQNGFDVREVNVTETERFNSGKISTLAIPFDNLHIAVYEKEERPFQHLTKGKYEALPKPYHRGMHKSCAGVSKTVAVFYNGLGWVDMSLELVERLIVEFGLNIKPIVENNRWHKRQVGLTRREK